MSWRVRRYFAEDMAGDELETKKKNDKRKVERVSERDERRVERYGTLTEVDVAV